MTTKRQPAPQQTDYQRYMAALANAIAKKAGSR